MTEETANVLSSTFWGKKGFVLFIQRLRGDMVIIIWGENPGQMRGLMLLAKARNEACIVRTNMCWQELLKMTLGSVLRASKSRVRTFLKVMV